MNLSYFSLFCCQYCLVGLHIFQRLMNEILLFLLQQFFFIGLLDWICNKRYFFLLNCLFSLLDGLFLVKRSHFSLDRKAREHIRFLCYYGRRFGENGMLDIFDDFSLFGAILLCDFWRFNLKYLYAKTKLIRWYWHLMMWVLFLIIYSHLLRSWIITNDIKDVNNQISLIKKNILITKNNEY